MAVTRNQNHFRAAACIPNTSAKYELKILALCDATAFFTSIVEMNCGKEGEGLNIVSNSPVGKIN
jgi:hypothetical protein